MKGCFLLELKLPPVSQGMQSVRFCNAVTRDCVYSLVPEHVRCMCHYAIARHYERAFEEDLRPWYYSLTRHFFASNRSRCKTMEYASLALAQSSSENNYTAFNQLLRHIMDLSPTKQEVMEIWPVIERSKQELWSSGGSDPPGVLPDGMQGVWGRVFSGGLGAAVIVSAIEKLAKEAMEDEAKRKKAEEDEAKRKKAEEEEEEKVQRVRDEMGCVIM